MNRPLLVVLALAVAPAHADPPPPPASAHSLTFAQAVDVALEKNPQQRLARATVAAADAHLRASRALRYPSLSADGNLFVWDKALQFELGGTQLPAGFDTTVRERVTWALNVTLTQPITGLLLIGALVGVDKDGADAARFDSAATRLDVAARAAEAFLRALQARAALEIGKKSFEQLEAQLARARILENGGVLGRVDILRLESARDTARLAILRAEAGSATSMRGLALALGLPSDTPLEIADDLPDPLPPPRFTEAQAATAAAAERPELRAARERIDQAEGARRVAMADYFPDVRALATYQHSEGNSTFQPRDAWYVGLTMRWSLWNWGHTGAGVAEAAQRKQQAIIAASSLGDQVAFEARRLALEAANAYQALEVTASSLRAAEEAYRIQSIRYGQGAATTTDVLESETEVARARSAAAITRYDYLIAISALARSAGELPRL